MPSSNALNRSCTEPASGYIISRHRLYPLICHDAVGSQYESACANAAPPDTWNQSSIESLISKLLTGESSRKRGTTNSSCTSFFIQAGDSSFTCQTYGADTRAPF